MNKQFMLLALVLVSTFGFAQKANVKTRAITAQFDQPEFLKNTKTFSYTIQDDGVYWNYTATNDFPDIASNTDGLNISGLEQVKDNGDLQIIIGFSGNQLKKGQGVLILNGTFNIQILDAKNQLVTTIQDSKEMQVVVNPKKYPMGSRDQRNITKARIVTYFAEKLIKEKEHILSGKADIEVPFGLFKKVKGDPAESFNTESTKHIDAIVANSADANALDSAITFWKAQLDVDFGKKMKDKIKNKVIYANLASAQILKKDLGAAKASMGIIAEYKGLFDTWPSKHKDMLSRFEGLQTINGENMITVDVSNNSAYFITLNDVTYTKKKKTIACSKVEIMSFIPSKKSGIASLDSVEKPSLFIYEDGVKTLNYFGDDKVTISTKDGKDVVFKEYKGAYKACVKQDDGSYRVYNDYTVIN